MKIAIIAHLIDEDNSNWSGPKVFHFWTQKKSIFTFERNCYCSIFLNDLYLRNNKKFSKFEKKRKKIHSQGLIQNELCSMQRFHSAKKESL